MFLVVIMILLAAVSTAVGVPIVLATGIDPLWAGPIASLVTILVLGAIVRMQTEAS